MGGLREEGHHGKEVDTGAGRGHRESGKGLGRREHIVDHLM